MPENIRKISDQLSIGGQPTAADLQQAAQAGFKSALNLRFPDESNTLPNEQHQAETVGLHYAQVPLQSKVVDVASVQQALEQLQALPKPVLVYCASGARAGAIGLISLAKDLGLTLEQLTEKATAVGVKLDQPHLQQFIQATYGGDNRQELLSKSS